MKVQMKELYNKIFVVRQTSLQFAISEHDKQSGSRIGGYAPAYFDDDLIVNEYDLQEYVYYFSIGIDLLPNLANNEVSVFIPKDFNIYNRNNTYPHFPIKCIMHTPSIRGNNEAICNKCIMSKQLVSKGIVNDIEEVEDVDELGKMLLEPIYGNKIGGTPALLQNEPSYYTLLEKDKYVFIMQFDESSYLRNQVVGNEPFNHGIIYFYGKFEDGILVDLVGGFWQN